jgi:hypothetical protein
MSGPTPEAENPPADPVSSPAQTRRARMLLILFSVLLGLWIAAMIAMYVTTVYPERYPATIPSKTAKK